jgi:hypothetical protein
VAILLPTHASSLLLVLSSMQKRCTPLFDLRNMAVGLILCSAAKAGKEEIAASIC